MRFLQNRLTKVCTTLLIVGMFTGRGDAQRNEIYCETNWLGQENYATVWDICKIDLTPPSQFMRLTNNGYYVDWDPCIRPTTGDSVVFVSNRDGNWELYMIKANIADQTDGRRLTYHPAPDWYPVFSPDGQKIAFASKRSGNWDIYIMVVNGSNLQRLTTNSATDWQPCFSLSGDSIAFASDRNGNFDIWLMPLIGEGYGIRQLTTNQADDEYPCFTSWNSDSIAFSSDREDTRNLYIIDKRTGDGSVRRLTVSGYSEVTAFNSISLKPNPFKTNINYSFSLTQSGPVEIKVYDLSGRCVKTLLRDQFLKSGIYSLRWNGEDEGKRLLPNGIYFLKFTILEQTVIKKVVLMR